MKGLGLMGNLISDTDACPKWEANRIKDNQEVCVRPQCVLNAH